MVGAELDFDLEVLLKAGPRAVRGQIDRLERDTEGRGHVVDYKTGRTAPGAKRRRRARSSGCTSSP